MYYLGIFGLVLQIISSPPHGTKHSTFLMYCLAASEWKGEVGWVLN